MNISEKEIEAGMEENPTQTVAMVAVQAIAQLSDLLYKAGGHDEDSERMVLGLCAWLTSVLDGKDPAPADALLDAAKTANQALIDEASRCQHYLTEMHERTKRAESIASINELYAGWYLRLRDRKSGKICAAYAHDSFCDRVIDGEDLDAEMEDLDTPSAALPPPEEFA